MFEPRPGAQVGGRYTLEEELAKGGMGFVWVATDDKLRRSVALKVLRGDWSKSADIRRRFEREAMVIAQLSCPQIVQIFDYGIEDEVPFIAMELLQGEDLQRRLKRDKKLSVDDASHIVWSTAKALGVAHGAGIVHRDLKPGNIFLVRHGDDRLIKVLDFGVARTLAAAEEARRGSALIGQPMHRMQVQENDRTRVGTVIGTPQYMSPEQARGDKNVDHRADLWSLGVIAYRMLTGRLPFRAPTAEELFAKLAAKAFPPATEVAPELPAEADAFFDRALAPDPSERFSDAKELARAFGLLQHVAPPSLRIPVPRAPLSSRSFDGLSSSPDMTPAPQTPWPQTPSSQSPGLTPAEVAASPSSLSHAQLEIGPPPRHRWGWTFAALLLGAGVAVVLTLQLLRHDETSPAAAPAPSDPPPAPTTPSEDDVPAATAEPSATAEPDPSAQPSASSSAEGAPAKPPPIRPGGRPVVPPPPPPPEKTRDPFSERL